MALSVSTAPNGSSFVTGFFSSPTLTVGTTTLTSSGGRDILVIKYDPDGIVEWAKSFGGTTDDAGNSICTDGSGNCYLTGYFNSTMFTVGTTTLTNAGGNSDLFVIKLNGSGNPQWALSSGGTSEEVGTGVSVDALGNSFVTGFFDSPAITFDNTTLTNSGGRDLFVVKFNSTGMESWAKNPTGVGNEAGEGIKVDAFGNCFVTGYFNSPSLLFGTTTLTSAGDDQIFLAKYDASGNAVWAKGAGGTTYEYGKAIDIDLKGNIFVAGYFGSPSITFGTTTLNNSGSGDMFLVKYDSLGAVKWAKKAGGPANELAYGVSVDPLGNCFVIGSYRSSTLTIGTTVLTNVDNSTSTSDVFIAKYDSLGVPGWAKTAGGTDTEIGYGVSAGGTGNCVIAGYYRSASISFGTIVLGSGGNYDLFVAKLSSICNLSPPAICLVTVDSASKHNNIIWDKTPYTNVDSFIVYREISTNQYKRIGAVSPDSLSLFVDTVETKYFPNSGNPNSGTYRYKLQLRDTCGNYSALSAFHNTIFMTNTNGTFSWPQLYTIENGPNPVNDYVLMRDNLNNGTWIPVNSVAGTQQSVTDPNYATWSATANWRISTNWNISCVPTSKYPDPMGTIKTTKSNTFKTGVVSLNEVSVENRISVSPNPSGGVFTVQWLMADGSSPLAISHKPSIIRIYNMLGQLMYSEVILENGKEMKVDLPKGVYQLQLENRGTRVCKKIIIQ